MRTLPALLRPVAVGAVLLAAVPMLLAGCSSDSSDDTAGDSSTTSASGSSDTAWLDDAKAIAEKAATVPTTINAAANGPVKPPASMDLFFIGCDQSIPGCVAQVQGVKEAAEVLGYDVEVCDAKSDTASFQNCFSQAVNAKPASYKVYLTKDVNASIAVKTLSRMNGDVQPWPRPLFSTYTIMTSPGSRNNSPQ